MTLHVFLTLHVFCTAALTRLPPCSALFFSPPASPTHTPKTTTAVGTAAQRLPLDTRTLGALAEKCHAFAKALHYKEMEFTASPQTAIEALIHINNQLRQPEAAVGVLTYAQQHLNMELKESWYARRRAPAVEIFFKPFLPFFPSAAMSLRCKKETRIFSASLLYYTLVG